MTKNEFIEVFRRQNGYVPTGDELDELLNEYQVEDDNDDEENQYWTNQANRQSRKIYNFSNNSFRSNNNNSTLCLIQELKEIFNEVSGTAKKVLNKADIDDKDEFSHMLVVFLLKGALYYALKSSYSKGYDAVNL